MIWAREGAGGGDGVGGVGEGSKRGNGLGSGVGGLAEASESTKGFTRMVERRG